VNIHVENDVFLISELVGFKRSASCPGCFPPIKVARYPLDRKLSDPKTGLEDIGEKSCIYRGIEWKLYTNSACVLIVYV
jgi:hypothetical protein